jgi:hypothetical protein
MNTFRTWIFINYSNIDQPTPPNPEFKQFYRIKCFPTVKTLCNYAFWKVFPARLVSLTS